MLGDFYNILRTSKLIKTEFSEHIERDVGLNKKTLVHPKGQKDISAISLERQRVFKLGLSRLTERDIEHNVKTLCAINVVKRVQPGYFRSAKGN